MPKIYLAFVLGTLCLPGSIPAVYGDGHQKSLENVVAGDHRTPAFAARDGMRRPAETLTFFGLEPGMTVVEMTPGGGGWYTEILAPYLRDRGMLYAANYDLNSDVGYFRRSARNYIAKLAADPDLYDQVNVTVFAPPKEADIAPKESADMVLVFRNVHNWMGNGHAQAAFRVFYRTLKPGGVLGVVQHRGDPQAVQDPKADSGYVTEEIVIGFAEAAGFKLDARSEINANPKDTKDHPEGVWTLPPNFRLGDQNRDKYSEIGETDRMTLRFLKPN